MNLHYKFLILLYFLLLALTNAAHSSVISGIGSMFKGSWDFSLAITVEPSEGDIFVADVVDPPLGCRVAAYMPPALIAEIPDSTFEDLKYAPEDTSMYDIDAPASTGRVYVAITMEGNYSKFRFLVLTYSEIIIEYVYQPDGSRKLFDKVGVEKHTWGKIKALYR